MHQKASTNLPELNDVVVFCFILFIFFSSSDAMAQASFDGDVGDEPEASINTLVFLGIAAGTYLGIKKLKV